MEFKMRMLSSHRRQMNDLLSDMSREHACFLLCKVVRGHDTTVLLVNEVLSIAPDDLLIQAVDQLSVSPKCMLRVARRAQSTDTSVCMVHTHPMSVGDVEFSQADNIGNRSTFSFFSRMLPNALNSCLVWDSKLKRTSGRVYFTDSNWQEISSVVTIGDAGWQVHSRRLETSHTVGEQFDRQAKLLGLDGQKLVEEVHFGIVGCGGIGSIASTLLVHAGAKKITIFDFDVVSASNLPRIIGSRREDAEKAVRKTEVLHRYVKDAQAACTVRCVNLPVEDPDCLQALLNLDVVICCTDDTTSRAFLNQICHQYYIPVLDLGVQFSMEEETGKLVSEVGKVNLMLPGSPCLSCTGHVNPHRLREESLSSEEKERLRADGYIQGLDVSEPSMMPFNMQVTARGVQVLIGWLTGLSPLNSETYEQFSFLGLLRPPGIKGVKKRQVDACPICGQEGSVLGRGDSVRLMVKPRKQ